MPAIPVGHAIHALLSSVKDKKETFDDLMWRLFIHRYPNYLSWGPEAGAHLKEQEKVVDKL